MRCQQLQREEGSRGGLDECKGAVTGDWEQHLHPGQTRGTTVYEYCLHFRSELRVMFCLCECCDWSSVTNGWDFKVSLSVPNGHECLKVVCVEGSLDDDSVGQVCLLQT